MRRAAYVAENLISCDKLYILIYNYVCLITTFRQHYVRDVGVAGSNPVTPTIDFPHFFSHRDALGASLKSMLGVSLGVSFDRSRSCRRVEFENKRPSDPGPRAR